LYNCRSVVFKRKARGGHPEGRALGVPQRSPCRAAHGGTRGEMRLLRFPEFDATPLDMSLCVSEPEGRSAEPAPDTAHLALAP